MHGNITPDVKRPGPDPISKLEKGGGAVWASRPGEDPILDLRYAPRDGADVVIEGTIRADALGSQGAVDHADAERLFAVAVDDLRLIGWKPDSSGIFKRTWIVRSDLDRSGLRRTVAQTIAVLARLREAEPSAYRLLYRPPGDEDAGYAQVGCVLAVPSVVIGDVVGGFLTVARDVPLPRIETAVLSAVVGFGLGFVVFGTLAPRALAAVPATRAGAAETAMSLQILIPGLVACATWLLLPVIGLRDGDLLLGISVGIVAAAVILPVPVMLLTRAIRGRS
jgi:hypothetical protein